MSKRVAVVDIGSNSIKLLVAEKSPEGRVTSVTMRTIDARISAGIGGPSPRLGKEGMNRGLAAVGELLAEAKREAPEQTILVATSAVRDASNRAEFAEAVRAASGLNLRILTGQEEAALVGRGLLLDELLLDLDDFHVFDLGGGSLECLVFEKRRLREALSLPLGCVRLMEKFVADPGKPMDEAARYAIAAHVRDVLKGSKFQRPTEAKSVAVGTGGTLTTVRTVHGARLGIPFAETSGTITIAELGAMLGWLGAMPLAERQKVPGLPPRRADVFPTALATVMAVADECGFNAFRHSLYNLRWGVADEAIA